MNYPWVSVISPGTLMNITDYEAAVGEKMSSSGIQGKKEPSLISTAEEILRKLSTYLKN